MSLYSSGSPTRPDIASLKEYTSYNGHFANEQHALSDIATLPTVSHVETKKRQNFLVSLYRSMSWIVGFREPYSLLCFIIFGGALLGFCLARSFMINPTTMRSMTVPGEFFWFDQKRYLINYEIHIYLSIVGGIFVGIQFLPAVRRRVVIFHRLNGYLCLAMLIIANVCGSIISRRSFGGEINAQSAYYILGIMIVFSALFGLYNVKKQTRQHRKWMLRMVVYFSTVITARLIVLAAGEIITREGGYYSAWRCDEMLYVVKNATSAQPHYPQCFGPGVDTSLVHIAVPASTHTDKLGKASAVRVVQGMALWVATLIHIIGAEIYLRRTESLNHTRYGYVLEPIDFDGGGQTPWQY